jgi:hypothetical protein
LNSTFKSITNKNIGESAYSDPLKDKRQEGYNQEIRMRPG